MTRDIRGYFQRNFLWEKLKVVPFPCYLPEKKGKEEARERVVLEKDKKILLSFARFDLLPRILPAVEEVTKDYPLKYLCMVNSIDKFRELERLTHKYQFLEVRLWRCPIFSEEFHNYIFSADVIVDCHREGNYIPVSSIAHICLGFSRPLLCPDNNFFYTFKEEVFKYKTLEGFKEKLIYAFEKNQKVLKLAEKYARINSAKNIARKILALAEYPTYPLKRS